MSDSFEKAVRQFAFDIVMTELGMDESDQDDQEYASEAVDAWMEHWRSVVAPKYLHTSQNPDNSQNREVLDEEVEAVAEAVFHIEADPQRWENTTESMRTIYRASIRKALEKVRVIPVSDGGSET